LKSSRFIALLCSKAARDIRLRNLTVVASELKGVDYADHYHKDQITTYSHFLTTIWQENQEELHSDKGGMANFQQVLSGLIAVQDSNALALADSVRSIKSSRALT
jgi:hypothetical protein